MYYCYKFIKQQRSLRSNTAPCTFNMASYTRAADKQEEYGVPNW